MERFQVVCEWPDREFLIITMTRGVKLEVELVWGASEVTGRIKRTLDTKTQSMNVSNSPWDFSLC